MAFKMLAKDVADAFVKQYYAILHRCPENVHKFYQEQSLLGWPGPDEVATPVTTLSKINDKVMSSDHKYYPLEVTTVEAQDSLQEGVIVAVTGSVNGKDEVRRNFSQTFFLARQEKGFYVLNDILQFLNASGSKNDAAANNDSIQEKPAAPYMHKAVAGEISDSVASVEDKAATETVTAKETSVPSISKADAAKGAASPSSVVSNDKAGSVVAPALNTTPKISYASMVAKEASVSSPRPVRVTMRSTSPKTRASAPPSEPKASSPHSATSANKVTAAAPVDAFGEATGIYIGRLPYNITKQGVVDVIKQFGPVRRFADAVQIRRHEDGFCCGFVEFESAESAHRAVEAHRVRFGDKESYISYKKSYSHQGNNGGGRSPTRFGDRRDSWSEYDRSQTRARRNSK